MKTVKKFKLLKVCLALTVFCAVFAFPFGASAAPAPDNAQQIIDSANQKIASDVQKAQGVYGILSNNGFSDDGIQIQNQCDNLQKETDNTAAQAEKKLDKFGVQYTVTYDTVNIGSNAILVDPFLCVA
jgi:lipopolysaccharide export LptBFGC system permease protein LptF